MHLQKHYELQKEIKNEFMELWKNSPEFVAFTQRKAQEDEKQYKWFNDILEQLLPKPKTQLP
jgi:hypothetical protein